MISNAGRRQFLAGVGATVALAGWPSRAAGLQGVLPFVRPSDGVLFGSRRKVFAHWHWFPISFDNKPAARDYYAQQLDPNGLGGKYRSVGGYLRNRPLPRLPRAGDWRLLDMIDDLAFASAIGIDAFQLNLEEISPGGPFMRNLNLLLDGAVASRSGTKVFPSLECASPLISNLPVETVAAALIPALEHPGVYRGEDGKVWLGAFYAEKWDVARWSSLLALLRAKHDVHFFPVFLNAGYASADHLRLANTVGTWSAEKMSQIGDFPSFRRRAVDAGAGWCQPVWPQDMRPKDGFYTEAGNSLLFRRAWEAAIDGGADAVNMTTWNDYSEGSALRPSTCTQFGYYDLAAYYIAWLKTGAAPQIVRDVLYYFHRIEAPRGPGIGVDQSRRFVLKGAPLPSNLVEVVACLSAPGEVTIQTSQRTKTAQAPRGLSSITAPLAPGRPRFALSRSGAVVLSFESAFPILRGSRVEDFLYRAGSSSRPQAPS
jgi:hypothetical protein